ncbi:MAG: hypothetical protein D6794_10330 [Deltaproteobacteria bacterium]|nr:MAG: hypothetical protein D6794_10330 [Deltaproteobacteria bacterium]
MKRACMILMLSMLVACAPHAAPDQAEEQSAGSETQMPAASPESKDATHAACTRDRTVPFHATVESVKGQGGKIFVIFDEPIRDANGKEVLSKEMPLPASEDWFIPHRDMDKFSGWMMVSSDGACPPLIKEITRIESIRGHSCACPTVPCMARCGAGELPECHCEGVGGGYVGGAFFGACRCHNRSELFP